ncbi:MAG: chain-length determining protein [Prevotella sp.]|nr:chain-length determining protein [Prevotella sp.]
MKDNLKEKKVDYKRVFKEITKRKKLYFIVLPVTFLVSCIYIYSIPRGYDSETKMAPEMESPSSSAGSLSSIASSFGIDISDMQSADAITPLLYPELMDDNGFVAGLFSIKVRSKDEKIDTDYYTYMKKYQKTAWWNIPTSWFWGLFKNNDDTNIKKKEFDPYSLSKKDDEVVESMRSSITLMVDKKTGVITIQTTAQDPLICKTLADSVREHLQQFITKYRTNKARTDYEYYKKLAADAKNDYERARQIYGSYADANTNIILESYKSKQEDLENEMQLKFNAYSTMNTQLQAAKAKIQERTPAFTQIKGAIVPVKASTPKRLFFIIGMMIFAFFLTTLYILKDIVSDKLLNNKCD